ncbi:MAG: PD-(D/E)XK nuclease family transposase [Thiotrichaceae bacterium]
MFDDNHTPERYLQRIQLRNEVCEVFYDKLTFIFIEMPRFHKQQAELVTHFDKWLYLIKHLEGFEDIPVHLRKYL